MPHATALFTSDDLHLGELRCSPDDETFGEDALVTGVIVALPCTPTWVVRRATERHLVNANQAVIHQAGDVYRRERFQGAGYRCLFVYPRPSLVREIAAEFDPNGADADADGYRVPAGLVPVRPEAFALSRRLARHLRGNGDGDANGASDIRAADALHRVLRAVIGAAFAGTDPNHTTRARGRARTARAHAEIAEAAKETMTARFAERLTVDDLARDIHVSPYHLTRVFRRHTGSGLHQYLDQLRLRAAFDRLRDGDTTHDLAALAVDVGFSSHSHLTANFGRAFGAPPSVARAGGPRSPEVSRDMTARERRGG